MPLRTRVPRSTHQWLRPVFDYIDAGPMVVYPSGASGIPNAVWAGDNTQITQIGNSTGVVGFYGFTGIAPIATGGNGIFAATNLGASGLAATGMGASGLYVHLGRAAFNGGSGTPYSLNDLVVQLKNLGIIPA